MQELRIFISSPGDVAEEREKAKQVIAALQRRYDAQVKLVPVLWEDLAIPATASFQEGIDFVLSTRHRVDIAIFVLWSRLGSPLGDSIRKKDGSPYLSGTEREFDVMLSAFEQSGGESPVILAYTRDDKDGFGERLVARAEGDDALEELIRQRRLVKRFISERFNDEQGRNLRAYHSYREPVGFAQRLSVHLKEIVDGLLKLDADAPTWTEAPYRSLEAFDIQHAPIFFGRDEETCDVLQRLRDQAADGCAFACIVGASGSGKSSVARAGVAATLIQRAFDDGVNEWRAAAFQPALAAGNLFTGLVRCLADALPELHDRVGGIDELAGCLADHNSKAATILFSTACQSAEVKLGGSLRVLLVLDQMEELWTAPDITVEQRELFMLSIETLAQSGHFSVLATLRSDFYPQAQLSETFLRLKGERGHYDLVPPGAAALLELIVQPARHAGLTFERDERKGRSLDQQILKDATADPSALPLLQYALAELYEGRDIKNRCLTFNAYETAGGVEGALGKRVATTFDALPKTAQNAIVEILPLLVAIDTRGEQDAVRRRASLTELNASDARSLLTRALIEARILTTDQDANAPTASLAHESLLRNWPQLTSWLDTNRDLLHTRARIEVRIAEGSPLLDGDPLLVTAKAHASLQPEAFTLVQREFIDRATRAADERRLRMARVRRLVTAGLAILSCVACAAAVWAFQSKSTAEKAQRESDASRRQAEDLLEFSLGKTSRLLKAKGNTADLVELQKKVDDYWAALGTDEGNAAQLRRRAWSYVNEGDTALRTGDTSRSEEAYREALEILSKLADDDPENPDYRQELGTAYGSIAAALQGAGRMDEALAACDEYVVATESALAVDPSRSHLRRELAAAFFRRGDLKMAMRKDSPTADHQRALDLRLALVDDEERESAMPNRLSDLASSWHAMSNLRRAARDSAGALEAARESAKLREQLFTDDPDNATWVTDLAASLRQLSALDLRAGRGAESFSNLGRARDLLRGLHTQDVDFIHNLAVTHKLYGDQLAKAGKVPDARDAYRAGLDLLVPITERGDASPSLQRTLSLTWYSLSKILVQAGDKPGALAAARKALASYEAVGAVTQLSKSQLREMEVISAHRENLEN